MPIKVLFHSGPFKGTSVVTRLKRQSAQEYINEQKSGIREHLGVLETRDKRNGEKEAGK